jgi:hypothetical protein
MGKRKQKFVRAGLCKKIHFAKTRCKTGTLGRRLWQSFRVASSLLTARAPIMNNAQVAALIGLDSRSAITE